MPKRVHCQVGPEERLEYTQHYVTTPAQLTALAAWLDTQGLVAFDLETTGLDWGKDQIITMQFGSLQPEPVAWIVDVRCFTEADLAPLYAVLAGSQVRKLGMNLGFEARFLEARGHAFRHVADIQLAELVLRAGLFSLASAEGDEGLNRAGYAASSMAALAGRYLEIGINKDEDLRRSFAKAAPGHHSDAQLLYAGDDVILPFFIWRQQQAEIRERELGQILKIEFAVLPVVAKAEVRGMRMDREPWLELWQEALAQRADAEARLDTRYRLIDGQGELFPGMRPVTGKRRRPVNYDSPKQVLDFIVRYAKHVNWPVEIVTDPVRLETLLSHYGQEWLSRRPDRKVEQVPYWVLPDTILPLTDTKMRSLRLARLRGQLPADLVEDLVQYSTASHLSTSFGKAYLDRVGEDGRLHPTFHQAITSTGRLSSQPNIQNVPHDQRYRRCFVPDPGYKYVIMDYSQIEPRLSAQVSKDSIYLETFRRGLDIYLETGSAILGRPIDKTTEEGALQRAFFKAMVLALAYRMGPNKLWAELLLALEGPILSGQLKAPTREEVARLHARFFEVHEGIAAYQDKMGALADPESGPKLYDRYLDAPVTWVTSPCGRKRYFPPDAKRTYTEGPNAPIQGASATITKLAAALVQQEIDRQGFDAVAVNLVHDEIVWEVREDQAAAFAPLAKRLMEEAAQRFLPDVPVTAAYPEGTDGVVDAWIKKAA